MMKNKITVSAPGKLMLLGDHAVVHDRPCLVTAVDQRIYLTAEILDEHIFELYAPDVQIKNYKKNLNEIGDGYIPKGAKFIEIAIKNFSEIYPIKKGLKISTRSDFSSSFGFGSSSASTVCILKALSELLNLGLSPKEIFNIAYKTVLDIQGVGSGFDIAASIYGGVLYFLGGGKIIDHINVKSLPLVVGFSGIKADTAILVKELKEKAKIYPSIYKPLFDVSSTLVENGRKALVKGDFEMFGQLMNVNEGLLASYGVEISKLADMIYAARGAGAYGAKLSGAGGGDCMIAIIPEEKREEIETAIEKVGGEILKVQANAEGVRVE